MADIASAGAAVRAMFERVPKPLRGDYVMAFNRIVAGSLMLLTSSLVGRDLPFGEWALPIVGWTGCGLLLFMQMRILPGATVLRRSVGIALDVSGASIMLAAGGESTAFVYVIYLWVIIGNGFRFGPRYIFAASIASIAGFSAVASISPFWHSHPGLSFGLLSGIIVLPAYSFALIRQVAEARLQAERADQAKTLFLASVSHELRTPLNAIIGTAELLARTPLTPDQAGMVATINNAADGQLSLVRDVLEFSRIEAGHGVAERTQFHLADMLGVVRAIVSVAARRKGLLLNSYITARTPLALIGDERHLREVLLNLCDNAVKFTKSGSVTIAADGTQLAGGRVALRLEVADTGIGIDPSATQRIFNLFTQADAGIAGSFGGTGLGLALCERQVRLMGGTIGVDSAPGAGATFFVCVDLDAAEPPSPPAALHIDFSPGTARLAERAAMLMQLGAPQARVAFIDAGRPAAPPPGTCAAIEILPGEMRAGRGAGLPGRAVRELYATSLSQDCDTGDLARALHIAASFAAQGGSLPPPDHDPPRDLLAGLRVLVADDNAINRTIVSRMLEGAGMRAVTAQDGEEALALMTDGAVDLALLDVNMPVMDGIEAAQFYRIALPGGGGVPLIALTADATPQTRDRCLRAGMSVCLVKPVRTADLLDALRKVLPAPLAAEAAAPLSARPPTAPPAAVLDLTTLTDLQGLGGPGFVGMLVEEFRRDGGAVMAQLAESCLDQDARGFRTRAHSLCSISANVGARALRDLCLPWKDLPESTLDRDAETLMRQLREEWARTQQALDDYITGHPP